MFQIGFLPALILLIGMAFLPETSRWLISKGRFEEGRKVLERIEDPNLLKLIPRYSLHVMVYGIICVFIIFPFK